MNPDLAFILILFGFITFVGLLFLIFGDKWKQKH